MLLVITGARGRLHLVAQVPVLMNDFMYGKPKQSRHFKFRITLLRQTFRRCRSRATGTEGLDRPLRFLVVVADVAAAVPDSAPFAAAFVAAVLVVAAAAAEAAPHDDDGSSAPTRGSCRRLKRNNLRP